MSEVDSIPTRINGRQTAEYVIWAAMKARCKPTARPDVLARYAGRGIRVCERWAGSYSAFFNDVGPRPSRLHSIERDDNDRGYSCGRCSDCETRGEPANCRWATRREQNNNTRRTYRITFRGETKTAKEWAAAVGLKYSTIIQRLEHGWHVPRALTEPSRYGRGKRHLRRRVTRDDERNRYRAVWYAMVRRCTNQKDRAWKWYGAKGVKVSERWLTFENFAADMGPRPSPGHSLDRYPNPAGDYEPSNVRWATRGEQARNKRAVRSKMEFRAARVQSAD